ncbi:hypothetical protein D9M72_547200 [compost metagenome]
MSGPPSSTCRCCAPAWIPVPPTWTPRSTRIRRRSAKPRRGTETTNGSVRRNARKRASPPSSASASTRVWSTPMRVSPRMSISTRSPPSISSTSMPAATANISPPTSTPRSTSANSPASSIPGRTASGRPIRCLRSARNTTCRWSASARPI